MYSLSHVVDHPMSSPCCVAKAGPVLAYRIMYLNDVVPASSFFVQTYRHFDVSTCRLSTVRLSAFPPFRNVLAVSTSKHANMEFVRGSGKRRTKTHRKQPCSQRTNPLVRYRQDRVGVVCVQSCCVPYLARPVVRPAEHGIAT